LQEDKEGLFDAIDTVKYSLAVYRGMLSSVKVNKRAMRAAVRRDFSNATDLADYLVRKNMPFRKAHAVAGQCVYYALKKGKLLENLTIDEYKAFSPLFEKDVLTYISIDACLRNRNCLGGPAPAQTEAQIGDARLLLRREKETIKRFEKKI
jgi:argininosuccinate lyase